MVAGENIVVSEASIHISAEKNPYPLAIRPYPKELEEIFLLRNECSVLLRPIRPEDELNLQAFDNSQSKEDRYKRYFAELPQFSHEQLARLTQIDYEREMAFVAVTQNASGNEEILGVVRAQRDPDNTFAEFAMAIRSDLKGIGLGSRMLQKMIDYARGQGTQQLIGCTMLENSGMANLARKLGFSVKYNRDEGLTDMVLVL